MRKIILMVLLLMMVCGICSAADRYQWLTSGDRVDDFFDTQTIKFEKNWDGTINYNIIDVWVKEIYTSQGVTERIKQREKNKLSTDGWEELDYEMDHYKFNTRTKQITNIGVISYNTNGYVLANYTFSEAWDNVIPNSNGEVWTETLRSYALNNKYTMEMRSR